MPSLLRERRRMTRWIVRWWRRLFWRKDDPRTEGILVRALAEEMGREIDQEIIRELGITRKS